MDHLGFHFTFKKGALKASFFGEPCKGSLIMTCFGHQNDQIVSLICCIKLQDIFITLVRIYYFLIICNLSLLFVVTVVIVVTVATELLLLFLLFVMIVWFL